MDFTSDNIGPAHPRVMEALARANEGTSAPYGFDDLTAAAVAKVREVFEAPEAEVFFVVGGTAANALLLGTLSEPWHTVFCSDVAHVLHDECNAPEFYAGGAKLTPLPARDGKVSPKALDAAVDALFADSPRDTQAGPVSLTNVTERGTLYTAVETAAIAARARAHGLPVHLDGARFANACASLGATPADLTWRAGVDALSFGGTKNGCLALEAAILFDPAKAAEFGFRRMRGGHLVSKHRYLAAQMLAYLEHDLWLDMAGSANAAMTWLATGLAEAPDVDVLYPVEANMAFLRMTRKCHERLMAAGIRYPATPEGEHRITTRIVCDWSKTEAEIETFLEAARG